MIKSRQLNEMSGEEIREFETLFCKEGEFFSLQKDKYSQLRYTFIEKKTVTLPANKKMLQWLKERGFEL